MAKLLYKSQGVTIEVSTDLRREVEAAITGTERAVLAALRGERDRVLESARANWPVRTGRSRAGLYAADVVEVGKEVRATVRNDVGYARFVPFRQTYALPALLRRPLRAAARRLVRTLPGDVVEALSASLPTGGRR